jgi:flavin-dependent dehydrogenase
MTAGFLIDAAGRNGLALPDRAERVVDDELLAVALRVSYAADAPGGARTYIETAPGGWWYTGLLPNGELMAMFFTDAETYHQEGVSVGERLAARRPTRDRLRGARLESSRVVYAPSSCRTTIATRNWAAVGDSASAYDPLSGRGIFKALRHAASLAQACVSGGLGLADHSEMVRAEFETYTRQRREYYASEQRWANSGFWQRRTAAWALQRKGHVRPSRSAGVKTSWERIR